MSKSTVPDVYAKVIKDVCEASRIDFEEGGVDLGVLDLLKQGWQKRLTATKIATFPWDPKPEPVKTEPAPINNKPVSQTLPSNGAINTPPSSHSTPGPQVKHEPNQYATQPPIQASYAGQRYPSGQPMSAPERAAMLLQQRYGDQVNSQIAQLQGQQQTQHQRVPQNVPGQQPYIKQEDANNQDYRQTYNAQVPIKNSQTDGAGDARAGYETEIAQRRALVSEHREAGDRLIRDRVMASQQSLEAGGLMLPFEAQQASSSKGTAMSTNSSLARAQGDAAGDEDDEDAINSDLDDPDELGDNENDEDNVNNVMLCTYDKVQRVKNKWKCTLKDGVLKVDDNDFVFHKGQGEFEW